MDKFKILIENYDYRTGNYKLGKQEILFVSLESFKNHLNSLPIRGSSGEHNYFHPRIITDDCVFYQMNIDEFYCKINIKSPCLIYRINPKEIKTYCRMYSFNEDLERIREKKNKLKKEVERNKQRHAFLVLPFIISLLLTIFSISQDINHLKEKLYTLIINSILLIFFGIYFTILDKKSIKKYDLDNSTPFEGLLDSFDLTEIAIIVFSYVFISIYQYLRK